LRQRPQSAASVSKQARGRGTAQICGTGAGASPLNRSNWPPCGRAAIGGSIFAGVTAALKSPYLLGIGVYVVLARVLATFLYFHQAYYRFDGDFRIPGAASPCSQKSILPSTC